MREKILAEFDQLLGEQSALLKACGYRDDDRWQRWPAPHDYLRLRTRTRNLVERVCGADSEHTQALVRLSNIDHADETSRFLAQCFGILQAARDDFARGLLFNLKSLVEAEVLGDFLEQAETLLSAAFHIPTASLLGAVLEDSLRKLCDRRSVAYAAKTGIETLNSALAKAGVYNKLVQKQITALADIRNNADHGQFDRFKRGDVEEMLRWITRFVAEYLK